MDTYFICGVLNHGVQRDRKHRFQIIIPTSVSFRLPPTWGDYTEISFALLRDLRVFRLICRILLQLG